jgi:hypothetical protein
MIGRNIATLVVVIAMAGPISPVAAATAGTGLVSNRMALALPLQDGGTPCRPVPGDPSACAPIEATTAHASSSWTVPLLLGGVAAAGIGVAVATSGGHHKPVSP